MQMLEMFFNMFIIYSGEIYINFLAFLLQYIIITQPEMG